MPVKPHCPQPDSIPPKAIEHKPIEKPMPVDGTPITDHLTKPTKCNPVG